MTGRTMPGTESPWSWPRRKPKAGTTARIVRASALLAVEGVTIRFGGVTALQDV